MQPRLDTLVRVLTIAVALVNVGDIALHVAIDQVEPLRVAGNIVVIVAAIGLLAVAALRRPAVPIAASVVNVILNLVFIVMFGIGGLGAVLIALTTILLATIAGGLRTRPRPS
jgi:collagenase-like PrtC family protease